MHRCSQRGRFAPGGIGGTSPEVLAPMEWTPQPTRKKESRRGDLIGVDISR
jgi:hypothetical protein